MVNLPRRFIKDIESIVNRLVNLLGENLREIILFGSCARGEMKTGSDIDLLVITNLQVDTHEKRGQIRDSLDEYNVDLVFYTQQMFNEATSLFVSNIKREKISLWKEGVWIEKL